MKIGFSLPTIDGECRCIKCGQLLAKVKDGTTFAIIEIKCSRGKCNKVNTFEIRQNENSTGN